MADPVASVTVEAGLFYPFKSYINDLALTLDGTFKLYPSKFIAFNSDGSTKATKIDQAFIDKMDLKMDLSGTPEPNDYQQIRGTIFSNPDSEDNTPDYDDGYNGTTPNQQDVRNFGKLVCIGDINLLNHDIYNGLLYAETYVYISQDTALRYKYLAGKIGTQDYPRQDESIFITDSNDPNPAIAADKTITFDRVVVFYNLYRKGVDATKDEEAYARDMPMGVYLLPKPQTLLTQSETLYGSGTSWAVRICSRFISAASVQGGNNQLITKESDYTTITKVLSEFGNIAQTMQSILNTNIDNIQTVKSYLEDFKNTRHINVPYIIGGHWYVNGKDVGSVMESMDFDSYIENYIKTHTDLFGDIIKQFIANNPDIFNNLIRNYISNNKNDIIKIVQQYIDGEGGINGSIEEYINNNIGDITNMILNYLKEHPDLGPHTVLA